MPPRPRARPCVCVRPLSPASPFSSRRCFSTSQSKLETPPPPPPQRWISDLRARVGKCVIFGCSPAQVSRAAQVCRALATEWRELTAGSEGFLTGGRRGLEGQKVVWGEMDSFQHVNNVNYIRYAESARVNWVTNFAVHVDPAHRRQWSELMTPRSVGLIMKSIKADYKFPMTYPDKVSVYHKLRNRPSGDPSPTSMFLDCMVLSHRHQRVSARTEEDIVIYDYKLAQKTEMPSFMKDVLEETYNMQEEATVRARTRIWELIGSVEKLEKETWDRADAQEDMGSATKSK